MHIRKLIYLFFASTLLGFLIYSYLHYSQLGEFPNFSGNGILIFNILAASNFIGFSIVWVNALLNKILFKQRKIGLRFIIGLIVNYAIIISILYACINFYLWLSGASETINELLSDFPEIKARVYILALVLDILLVVFNFLIYSYKHYSHGQIQNAQLKRKQLELQFEALKTQLSPHYLFNSLNTISSLIYKDIDKMEDYIRKLANTYQYILKSDKEKLINLNDEFNFVKDYCYLLKIRFGDAFKVHMDIKNKYMEYKIPPISIQILIENAVKHNAFDDDESLEIDIVSGDDFIYVKNRILKRPEDRESFGIGLDNIKRRYEVFTDKRIKIVKNEHFTVELPLLHPAFELK